MIVNLLEHERGEQNDREGFRFFDLWVGHLLGAEVLSCALYDVPPGEQLWPYHFHHGNEEWAVVVAGRPTVRTPDSERELVPGDLVPFPDGEDGAHSFTNRSGAEARVLLFSTLNPPTVPVYPDSGKIGAKGRYFRLADAVDYWDGE